MTEIQTGDWRRAVAWYRDVLGLRVALEDAPNQFALLEADSLGSRVALKGERKDRASARGVVQLVFEVVDLAAMIATLTARGVAIEGPTVSAEGYRAIKLHDPDGTPIRIFEWVESDPDPIRG